MSLFLKERKKKKFLRFLKKDCTNLKKYVIIQTLTETQNESESEAKDI